MRTTKRISNAVVALILTALVTSLAFAQGGAPAAAKGPILDSKAAQYTALGVGAGLTIWVLAHSDNPVSPSIP